MLISVGAGPDENSIAPTARRKSAERIAGRMPLVRVVVNLSRVGGRVEIEDIFESGVLKPGHKSECASLKERLLRTGDALYFHGGRTHPQYGKAVLVLRDVACALEATPFALGGLLCRHPSLDHEECFDLDADMHQRRGCAHPIAHDPIDEQIAFVAEANWGTHWRARLADYLDAHFEGRSDLYFAPGSEGRPRTHEPNGVSRHAMHDDWRAWTVEVRALEAIDLFRAFDQIMFWALDPMLEDRLARETSRRGMSMTDRYPFYDKLRRAPDRRVGNDTTDFGETLTLINRRIEEELNR